MAFLRRGLYIKTLLTFRMNPSPTILHDFTQDHFVKTPSLPIAEKTSLEGSMTVEAAVLLPIIISLVLFMGGMIEAIRTHGKVQMNLWNIGTKVCMYGYLTDGFLENSMEGMDLVSSLVGTGDIVELNVTYQEGLGDGIISLFRFWMRNRYYGHMWTGYNISDKSTETIVVYVAENGTVYHLSRDCSYIDIQPICVESHQLTDKTNLDGAAYKACLKCRKEEPASYYYITEWGDCYHWQQDCRSLKRLVFSAVMEEVSALVPCSRCSKEGRQ